MRKVRAGIMLLVIAAASPAFPVHRKALEDVGKIDAAGGIVGKAVVPIPTVAGKAADVSNLVWSEDPEELRKINEQSLADLGVDKKVAAAFFKNKAFSPSRQTRFVAALSSVSVAGLDRARDRADRQDDAARSEGGRRDRLAGYPAGAGAGAAAVASAGRVARRGRWGLPPPPAWVQRLDESGSSAACAQSPADQQ